MKRRKLLISFEFSQFRCHSEGISFKLVSILYGKTTCIILDSYGMTAIKNDTTIQTKNFYTPVLRWHLKDYS